MCLCARAAVPLELTRTFQSDLFGIIAGILLFGYVPSLFYILSAALIVAGLVLYNVGSAPTEERHILQPVAAGDSGASDDKTSDMEAAQ